MVMMCSKCVMDITAKEITFDEHGICNFCHIAQKELAGIDRHNWLKILDRVKQDGKKYDCIIGLSGGVDSSMALVRAVENGLRPMCFSVDNGWNDPRADENVMRLVEGLKVPFYRYVLDQREFKALQAAFLKAGVVNVEIPTDHVLMAVSYDMAKLYGVKWIISGGNVETESIMPASWSYTARDFVHIKDVCKLFGVKLKNIPTCSLLKYNYYKWIKRVRTLYILDYVGYNRQEAIKTLSEKFGYQPYGDKHCENVWTTWFQNFYLFEKWGIDKRKAFYSSLINSGQMTRSEALEELTKSPIYPKLGIESRVLAYPKHSHYDYKTDEKIWKFLATSIRQLRKPYRKLMKNTNSSVV